MLKEWLRSAILALIFAVFITTFVLQNATPVTVSFLLRNVQTTLAIVIIVSTLVGVLCTGIIAAVESIRQGKKIASLEKQVKEFEGVYKEPAAH